MTVALVGVMAGVSVPLLIPRYRDYQVRSAAWQLAGDLRLARQRAVTTRVRYRLAFRDSAAAPAPNTYVLEFQPVGAGTWTQEVPPGPGARQRFPGPVQIDPASSPVSRAITFSPNGSVVPTGTVRLTAAGASNLQVTVDQAGRVRVNRP